MALAVEKNFVWVLVVLGYLVTISLQASSRNSENYVAAVVEYAPVSGATLENKDEIFMQNVAVYACFMEEAARQGADIIVFPEVGLASMGVPHNPDGTPSLAFYVPEPGANPCNDNSSEIAQGLRELSCAARRHGLYAVVNLPERVNCSGCPCPGFPVTADGEECPPSGAYFHNTNVAFDRTGAIVARYRKFNLFGEPGFVPTPEPEFSIFDTDFGVSFAMFICFDIMFEKPAVTLVREHNICDFAFPTAWFSEAPFLTAVQTQAAWAYSLDVNLLASGYNRPEVGSAGSGIFLGRNGAVRAIMPNTTTSRLLVGTVPKMQRCQETFASRARSRRAALAGEGEDDDNSAVERTPLSAFHHIVRQRKFGHLDMDVAESLVDESAPAFIHHKMYDQADDAAEADDNSGPPSGEIEPKVPPHFMGLHQTDQVEDDEETKDIYETHGMASEDAGDRAALQKTEEGKDAEETLHSNSPYVDEQKVDIPEKKIPASTRTDPPDYNEPSTNPDLLRLYQDEPEEQFPEEFLEIEVPESYERPFEPERDQEYFKLPDKQEILLADEGKKESREESDEENQQLLTADDSATAAADNADLTVSGGEHNATQEEIEATVKKFEWLVEDKEEPLPRDSPERKADIPSAPSAGNEGEEVPREEHIDDTDDLLADDHGLHLIDDGGQGEAAPREEHVHDTEDILADDHGLAELHDDEKAVAETDASPKQDLEGAGDQSEAKTLTDSEQPAESECEFKKPDKRGKLKCHRRDRVKRSKRPRKCRARPEGQKPSKEPDGVVTDDKPVVETSENVPEDVVEDTKAEEQPVKCEPEVTTSEPKRPCKKRERRESGCPAFSDGVLDDGRVSKSTAGLFLKRDHLEVYKTFTLSTESLIENSTVVLCDGTFCCNFTVVLEVNAELSQARYAYRLAVFDGVRSFDGVATGGLQVCGVIPCSRDDMDSCGMLTLPDEAAHATVFRTISISGVFSTNHTLVTANTLLPGLAPLPADRFNMTTAPAGEKLKRFTLKTTAAVMEEGVSLFTFAIYSRVYKRDGEPATTPQETLVDSDNC
ncbi:uncharacterized protein LOC126484137 [Schistocerca serialis cubense]|uniref:uncharacterized protein LOC126484137 n=1 Tax=Schistocerca serialis cubense TaxID=2023355 RepID=UPI00214E40B3|nr:uncharacterized protein LOC126484137 [Schistocerca serialis cubense]XP_049963476.1 uncharacterized protein LOC126484137 [Schistocerca serialis cubense]XP_049963477.1 uncharacterized protein LOC126484137 [Schistocerca serialis cubense]